MRYRLRFTVLIAAVMFAAGCSQSQTPTGPSPLSSLRGSTAAVAAPVGAWISQASGSLAVTWPCLTVDVGCPVRQAPSTDVAQEPPGPPSNLAFQVSGSTVILAWSPPGSGPQVRSYVVQAGTGPGLSNIASFDTGSTATTLTVTGVPAGTYIVRVRAANLEGPGNVCDEAGPRGGVAPICPGAASNEVIIVVGGCPPPTAPTGLTGSASGSTVTLQWTAVANAIAFIIEAGSTPGAANLASFDTGNAGTSFSATAPNGTYYLRIRVRTACGTSGVSNEVTVVVGSPPPPANLSGRWIGNAPDGFIINDPSSCDWEQDIQLDLTQTGSALTGTVMSRTRRIRTCGQIGFTSTGPLSGSVAGNAVTLNIPQDRGRTLTLSLTVTGNRMSGQAVGYDATVAVNRQ